MQSTTPAVINRWVLFLNFLNYLMSFFLGKKLLSTQNIDVTNPQKKTLMIAPLMQQNLSHIITPTYHTRVPTNWGFRTKHIKFGQLLSRSIHKIASTHRKHATTSKKIAKTANHNKRTITTFKLLKNTPCTSLTKTKNISKYQNARTQYTKTHGLNLKTRQYMLQNAKHSAVSQDKLNHIATLEAVPTATLDDNNYYTSQQLAHTFWNHIFNKTVIQPPLRYYSHQQKTCGNNLVGNETSHTNIDYGHIGSEASNTNIDYGHVGNEDTHRSKNTDKKRLSKEEISNIIQTAINKYSLAEGYFTPLCEDMIKEEIAQQCGNETVYLDKKHLLNTYMQNTRSHLKQYGLDYSDNLSDVKNCSIREESGNTYIEITKDVEFKCDNNYKIDIIHCKWNKNDPSQAQDAGKKAIRWYLATHDTQKIIDDFQSEEKQIPITSDNENFKLAAYEEGKKIIQKLHPSIDASTLDKLFVMKHYHTPRNTAKP